MEDEIDISFLAKFTLESNGYEVLTASNGQIGLDLVEKNQSINLIILDIMMPGMDGYQVLEKLKNDFGKKDIPVLIFSAMVQEKEIEKGYRLGASGYIKKPFDAENLLVEVERFLKENNSEKTDE
jgi:two-component system alkaline phosphatase synthesis response regulator PhoP